MRIFCPSHSKQAIGGGWTFRRNIQKALKDKVEFVDAVENCDILFIVGATMVQRDVVKKAKDLGKKVVLRIDGIPRNSRNRNTGTSRLFDYCQKSDVVIYQSEWAKQWIKPFIKKDGVVILNGADETIFKPEGDKIEKQGKPQWLYSRHNRDETKRWEEAWYQFQKSYYKNSDIHLWIVGKFSPTNREYNFDFFGGVEKRYRYFGIIQDPKEMAKLYRSADLLCLPYYMDACSNTAVEARLSGLKVVYNEGQGGGTKEIMEAPLEELVLGSMGSKYLKVFEEL